MCNHITKNEKELLEVIRNAYRKKMECKPMELSDEEYNEWRMKSQNYYLHKGFTSIWNGFEVPACSEVVIQKGSCRDGNKPYLVFESADAFKEFRNNSIIMGTTAYSLFEKWLSDKLGDAAKQNGLTEAEADVAQNEIECGIGLYYDIEDDVKTDDRLMASMCKYMKKMVPQKISSVYGKIKGTIIYIDGNDSDTLGTDESEPDYLKTESDYIKTEPDYSNIDSDINIEMLQESVLNYIDKISKENNSGGRFDIKDNLMPQVIKSENAVCEFLEVYYSGLLKRSSLWRPVALAGQVLYAFENGSEYLKNPAFISACNNVSLREMLSKQIDFACAHKSNNLVNRMNAVSEKLTENNSLSTLLKDCASSDEQIGKALSKELRTNEALCALSKAVAVAALESGEMKGEEYYE